MTRRVVRPRRGGNKSLRPGIVGRGNVKPTEAQRNAYDYGVAKQHHKEMALMPASKGDINGWFRRIRGEDECLDM